MVYALKSTCLPIPVFQHQGITLLTSFRKGPHMTAVECTQVIQI